MFGASVADWQHGKSNVDSPMSDATLQSGRGQLVDRRTAIPASDVDALRSTAESVDFSGRAFGNYQIGELLGAGGCGQVYAATHRWLERPVAIKFLVLPDGDQAGAMERFRRESVTAAKLDHPSFVRALDGGIADGRAFLVTDRIDGDDLQSIVTQHGPLSTPLACRVIAEVAKALVFLEQEGVVHRDLKPSNIMVDRRGRVYVLDLGLARVGDASTTLTKTGAVMGTVDYLAPEQALDPRRVTSRADMYSLGCTLYFLLTGRTPYEFDDADPLAARIMAHVEQEPRPIMRLRQGIPDRVIRLIDQMLEKRPEHRPRSFGKIASTLEAHAGDVELSEAFGERSNHQPLPAEFDWIDEWIVKIGRGIGQTLLVLTGFLESIPDQRPGGRARYRFSYRWAKVLGWVVAFYAFLYFAGIGFEIPELGITFGAPPPPGWDG